MPTSGSLHNALIRRLQSFAPLSDQDRNVLTSLPATIRVLSAGQEVAREGERASHSCIVLDGWMFRSKLLRRGRRQILSFHLAGDMPDLQTLHLAEADNNLTALGSATVALVPHKAIRELMARNADVSSILWRDALIEAAIYREWMVSMGRRTAAQRLGHLLCELYLRLQAVGLARDFSFHLPLTQTHLADALGVTPIHVNRIVQDARKANLIVWNSGVLVINDWPKLTAMSEFDPAYLHFVKSQPSPD